MIAFRGQNSREWCRTA